MGCFLGFGCCIVVLSCLLGFGCVLLLLGFGFWGGLSWRVIVVVFMVFVRFSC